MTTSTNAARPVREVPTGTLVIYTGATGTYVYEGPSGEPYAQIEFEFGSRREHHGLKCDPRDVAPADTTIAARDDRVKVTKRERGRFPTHKGPWLLTVASEARDFFATKRDGAAAGLRTVAILDWHAGTVAKPVDPNDHRPISKLNTTGVGIRSYFACSCGHEPRTMPTRGSTMHVSYLKHVRSLGIGRNDVADAIYAEGYAAAGMTWDQWYAAHPSLDPFTGTSDAERLRPHTGGGTPLTD